METFKLKIHKYMKILVKHIKKIEILSIFTSKKCKIVPKVVKGHK